MIDKRLIVLQTAEIGLILVLAFALHDKNTSNYEANNISDNQSVTQNIIIKEPAMVKVIGGTQMEKENVCDFEDCIMEYQLIEFEGNIKQKDINELKEEIDTTIPTWLLKSFIKNEWKILLTSKNVQEFMDRKWSNTSILALTDYRNKRIIISKRGIHNSIAHEFGHYLDITYVNKCSDTEEFKEIYNAEVEEFKRNIDNPNCVFSKEEFFAEAYYYSRVDDSKCTPRVLEYIDKVSKSYKEGSHI